MEEETHPKICDYTTASSDPVDSTEDRILKRGDLARIIGLQGKLKDHKGDLARVVRSNPITEEISSAVGTNSNDGNDDKKEIISTSFQQQNNGQHLFVYDLELVMGGKLNRVPRFELKYTTASEMGMTGDARKRRKRKPTTAQENNNNISSKIDKKKKITKKTAATTKNSNCNKNNKKRGLKNNVGNTSKKTKKQQDVLQYIAATSETTTANSLGMFERHRREFERSLLRLQKIDVYSFFTDDYIPEEFDECYGSSINNDDNNNNDDDDDMKKYLPGESTTMLTSGTQQPQITYNPTTTTPNTLISPQSSSEKYNNDDAQHEAATTRDLSSLLSSKENFNVLDSKATKSVTQYPSLPPYNFAVLRRRLEHGRYILDRERLEKEEYQKNNNAKVDKMSNFVVQNPIGIDWKLFREDIIGMCNTAIERDSNDDDGNSTGTLCNTAGKIKTAMEQIYEKTGRRQIQEMELSNDAIRFTKAMDAAENTEAAMQGKKWKRDAFAEREYQRLKTDAVCSGLSELDERIATYELQTNLKDSFLGLSYTYNDTGQSEGWMKTMLNNADEKNEQEKAAMALSSDDGVIKAQVAASMLSLLIAVQDRVMTDNRVLEQNELRSANWESGFEKVGEQIISTNKLIGSDASNPEIVEQPVWGMDCYTRKNISICLESKFNSDTILIFLEKWLLPAINACPVDLAHDLSNAARILEGLPFDTESSLNQQTGTTTEQWSTTLLGRALLSKINETGPLWLHSAARLLRKAVASMGYDFFRIHPKGHGSIVLSPKIEANRLVTFYRGEIYPSWRWGEKMDAISLIQERKNLKPRLPDFFNMALERPQMDPRGYGLLFVDASRKSGYGSMLSHSCNPSCEVRVAAVNGKLTLAMTTLRELTIGDEVTFDYNAVTESLHEYQDAVCLCGQVKCRGAFLHFATADCYQQVLNRNSPVAVRLSQLIKGCTKKVMSEDDENILKRHGFQTAAFGAVSVKRREATESEFINSTLDSMDFVPIWLRTHVADILRYIEYERRSLPIALISNQITQNTDVNSGEKKGKKEASKESDSSSISDVTVKVKSVDDKPVKGSKPVPVYFFFVGRRREHFLSLLMQDNEISTMKGNEMENEIRKLASAEWKSFDEEMKQTWKQKSIFEWEKSGGKEKALLEKLRQKRQELSQSKNAKQLEKCSEQEQEQEKPIEDEKQSQTKKTSFQEADAEGMTAMEQRIQQLTQTLSRVGRVLDRHREETLRKQEVGSHSEQVHSQAALRELAHSPLSIMPDEHVIAWMWNHEDGIIRTLLRMADEEICVSPDLKSALKQTESKYSALKGFGTPWEEEANVQIEFPMSPTEGRKFLDKALLEFRTTLVNGKQAMASEIKSRKVTARDKARRRKEQANKIDKISTSSNEFEIRYAIKFVLNGVLDKVEQSSNSQTIDDVDNAEILEPWLQNYNKRFKLEKAADLLLMYMRTSTFFRLVPYEHLQSTPIEVYAREIGNKVPRSCMDEKKTPDAFGECAERTSELIGSAKHDDSSGSDNNKVKPPKRAKTTGFCNPEDIVSEVFVDYQGDYVLSQLLQWYNAGIDQKPGLPDILGCALLPSMSGCWTIDSTRVSNSATAITTSYHSLLRPRLVEWLKDPYKRGNPWPDELRRGFVDKDDDKLIENASKLWLPIGSPILDFLVTGDDFSIVDLLQQLGTNSTSTENDVSDGLLSSIDHGRPAQAISNWVQCENPDCQKWRKIPWHVDIDMISEKFVCSDNLWGRNSCDEPDDYWDETTDAYVDVDGSIKPNETDRNSQDVTDNHSIEEGSIASCILAEFKVGGRFDVLRPGKEKWGIANVVDVAVDSNKIQVHFVRTQSRNDIWLERNSERIAPLHTHTIKSKPKVKSQIVCSKKSQERQTASSESKKSKTKNKSKMKKQKKSNTNVPQSSQSDEHCDSLSALSVERENEIDEYVEEDYEEIGIGAEDENSNDDDDDDDDDMIVTEGEVELKGDGDINGIDNEEFKKPISCLPTVTDHSSADGSPNSGNEQFENYCTKETDQTTSSPFKIPKKKKLNTGKSAPLVIPKKTQAPLSAGISLISNAARQVFEVKKKKQSPARYSKKLLGIHIQREMPSASTASSPQRRDLNFNQKNKMCSANQGSPSLNVKSISTSHQTSSSGINNGDNQRSVLSKTMHSPKHSIQDQYAREQRHERELYRDPVSRNRDSGSHPKKSHDYSTQREDNSYYDSNGAHERTNRVFNDQQSLTRQFDQSNPSCDDIRRRDDYEERYRSRTMNSYDEDVSKKRSRDLSREYVDYEHHHEDKDVHKKRSRDISREYVDYEHHHEDRYSNEINHYDTRRHEEGYKRPSREFNDRTVCQDDHRMYQSGNDYEERYSSRSDDNQSYREDDYYSRRSSDSGRRREERSSSKRNHDGTDEYSRRLDGYNHSQQYDCSDEYSRRLDRHDRSNSKDYGRR